jgi:hypothetical protein
MRTAAGRAALGKRQQFIELVLADAKVRHCLARAQRRGRDNRLIQALLTAATVNLRKLVPYQPLVGAAAMGGLRPLHGAVWAVRSVAGWATRTRSPFTALSCSLFAFHLQSDSALAFGNSL